MTSVQSSVTLLMIAYPLLFIVMAVFAGLTYMLNRTFDDKE